MKIVTNEPLIKRNTKIAQFSGLLGMVILLAGMYFLFTTQKDPSKATDPKSYGIVWGSVLGGFLLSQVGIYYMNRFGRRPRPDESLDTALKGLEDSYTIYHYRTPTPHLLVGPAGIWVLLTRHQKGNVTYNGKRYIQKGGGFMQGYLRLFGQEGVGRPDAEIEADKKAIERFLSKKLPDINPPEIQGALAFTDDAAVVDDMQDAPVPTVPIKKLKDVVRKSGKSKMPAETVKMYQNAIWSEEQ
jgi:hypothetical protein